MISSRQFVNRMLRNTEKILLLTVHYYLFTTMALILVPREHKTFNYVYKIMIFSVQYFLNLS